MKKRLITTFCLIIFVVIISIFTLNIINKNNSFDIDKILESKDYSYLPKEAKNYIKEVYEQTGELLLTEKNKKENIPYLNPDFVSYLENGNISESGYIPETTISDYNYEVLGSQGNLPSKYDSRDVNGISYVTSSKSQNGATCWDYSNTSVLETKILKENLYNGVGELDLSEEQINYVTASPLQSIDIEYNPYHKNYALENINNNGNHIRYYNSVSSGISPIYESDWTREFNTQEPYSPIDVWNLDKVRYDVDTMYHLIAPTDTYDENLISTLKELIISNGSAEISLSTERGCSVSYVPTGDEQPLTAGKPKNTLYYRDITYPYPIDHSIAIIGWDDDYNHNVCVLDDGVLRDAIYNSLEDNYSCAEGTLKELNGAWIAKNSWSTHPFVYVAYESLNSSFNVIEEVSVKDWDNVYYSFSYTKYNKTYTYKLSKKDFKEKLNKIKFYSKNLNNTIDIYVSTTGKESDLVKYKTINTTFEGVYTADFRDLDILLNNKNFMVKMVVSEDGAVSCFDRDYGLVIFTDNADDIIQIDIEDAETTDKISNQGLVYDDNVIILDGTSRNLKSDQLLTFKFYNSSNEEVTDMFNVYRNYSVSNYINSLIGFSNDVPIGVYTVKVYYNDQEYDSFELNINKYMENLDGSGTMDDPYILTNPIQLDMIRDNQFAFYKLGNDIDLTYDTQDENGLFYNNGKGWNPISYTTQNKKSSTVTTLYSGFSGGLDGDGHKIIGLYINRPDESFVGLFDQTYNTNYSYMYIKNIVFENPNITGNNYVGTLLGGAYGTTHERYMDISNIAIIGGSVSGNNNVGGIAGKLSAGSKLTDLYVSSTDRKRHFLNNLYNSASISGNDNVGGIFGSTITLNYDSKCDIKLSNIQNIGKVTSNGSASGITDKISLTKNNNIELSNIINTGIVNGNSNSYGIFGGFESDGTDNKISLINSYYIDNLGYTIGDYSDDYITVENVSKKSISDLRKLNNSWANNSSLWSVRMIRDIKRIPVLNFFSFDYTNFINSIDIVDNSSFNIYDHIVPNYEVAKNITFEIEDSSVAQISNEGIIRGISSGETSLHIFSNYDGYEANIPVNVVIDESSIYSVTYNENYGNSQGYTREYIVGNENNLESIERVGYRFEGWNTSSDGNGDSYMAGDSIDSIMQPGEGLLLYAQWEPIEYTIVLNPNGAVESIKLIRVRYNEEKVISSDTFTREGYSFSGYNTRPKGTGTQYNGNVFRNLTTVDNKEIYLYAQWSEINAFRVNKYVFNDIKNYIDLGNSNDTVTEYKSNFEINDGYDLRLELNDNEKIYTGSSSYIYKGNKIIKELKNIVHGDINGDGKISSLDYISVKNHIMRDYIIDEELQAIAADVNNDAKISALDYIEIKRTIMEGN